MMGEDKIDTYLELTKSLSRVNMRKVTEITDDFVLAKSIDGLNSADKEWLTESVANAFLMRQLLKSRLSQAKKHDWKGGKWHERGLNKEELGRINEAIEDTFSLMIIRAQMCVVLNRNVAGNPLLEIVGGKKEEEALSGEEIMKKLGESLGKK